jgi:hypothetical protein
MSEDMISIIGREDAEVRGPLGKRYRREDIPIERIKSKFSDFLTNLQKIFDDLPDKLGDYEVESMDVSVEISSKGNVSLIAVGGELGSTGGLTLHLKKRTSSEK